MRKIAAIVLAAGKGTRLNSVDKNKVMHLLGGKPMIGHTIDILKKTGLEQIVVVVGFAKESVKKYLGKSVCFAVQKEQLGTADAVLAGIEKLSEDIENVVVVYGDDSYCYPTELLKRMISHHKRRGADLTMLTVNKKDPTGLGRIIRDRNDKIIGIVEEKNANEQQKKIKEINTGCYIFKLDFLKKYLPRVQKNPISGEYYLTDLIELGVCDNRKIEAIRGKNIPWRGVNTPIELEEARHIMDRL